MRSFYNHFLLIAFAISVCSLNAQTTLYSENFNGATNTWTLNTTDESSTAGPNEASGVFNHWIVNNIYTGGAGTFTCVIGGIFPIPVNYTFENAPTQPAGITGNPTSNYMHITAIGGSMGAGYLGPDGTCVTEMNHFTRMTSDISTVGQSTVSLKFWWMGTGATNSYVELYYSTNGGSAWTPVNMGTATYFTQQLIWKEETVSIPAFANQATLRIGFRLKNGQGANFPLAEVGYAIDDFRIIGEGGCETSTWYLDTDGDGHGDAGSPVESCEQPEGYVTSSNDCDDGDQLIWLAKPAEFVFAANPSQVCITDAAFNLAVTPAGGTWSGTGVTGGVFNPATAGVGSHVISYQYSGDGACNLANSGSFTITVFATQNCASIGVNEVKEQQITLYPTTTNSILNVTGKGLTEAVIMDMSGKRVKSVSLLNTSVINMADISAGFYFVKVSNQYGSQLFKVTKVD